MRWLLSALLGNVVCPSAMVSKRLWVRNKNVEFWGGCSVNRVFFRKARGLEFDSHNPLKKPEMAVASVATKVTDAPRSGLSPETLLLSEGHSTFRAELLLRAMSRSVFLL